MGKTTQIPVADAWCEHVTASVNWDALRIRLPRDPAMSVSATLDLYLGGTIRHEYGNGRIYCHDCPFLNNDQVAVGASRGPIPACACHVGIVQAFVKGALGSGILVEQKLENNECHLMLHPVA